MSNPSSRPVHYVAIHRPGPKWQYGIDFREQAGVKEHVEHYLKFHEQGKLELGGPFLMPDMGGMMVATKDVSQQELEAANQKYQAEAQKLQEENEQANKEAEQLKKDKNL